MTLQIVKPIPLCSRCAFHEINSWLNEKNSEIAIEASQQISQELRAIKLAEGECIVCNKKVVSDGCFENIIRVMNKHKVSPEIVEEFKKFFGFQPIVQFKN